MMTKKESQKFSLPKIFLVILIVLLLSLGTVGLFHILKVTSSPSITILFPLEDVTLDAFSQVPVQATAIQRGISVSQLDFYVDGILAGSIQGEGKSINGNWQWQPINGGSHVLSFVAINKNGVMNLAKRVVEVINVDNEDHDAVPTFSDECPDVFGYIEDNGCISGKDEDGDGLIGDQDGCPTLAGLELDGGCPPDFRVDSDHDGVLDNIDLCPSISGLMEISGCPINSWLVDFDGDSIPDFIDHCPEISGVEESFGCTLARSGDQDGDGVIDENDECILEPGSSLSSGCPILDDVDSDGVPDSIDECPEEAGVEEYSGCYDESIFSDEDHDRTPDIFDGLPNQIGLISLLGAPAADDADTDGVVDSEDRCPSLFGRIDNFGCPRLALPENEIRSQNLFFPFLEEDDEPIESRSNPVVKAYPNDSDQDGVEDSRDICPHIDGEPDNGGCPPNNDQDRDGIPDELDRCDDVPGLYWGEYTDTYMLGCPSEPPRVFDVELEITALRLQTEMGQVYCYANSSPIDAAYPYATRIPNENRSYSVFPVEGYGYYLRLSEYWPRLTIRLEETQTISVYVACWGQQEGVSIPGRYLGEIYRSHSLEDWDGQIRYAVGIGDDSKFEVYYRICKDRCIHGH